MSGSCADDGSDCPLSDWYTVAPATCPCPCPIHPHGHWLGLHTGGNLKGSPTASETTVNQSWERLYMLLGARKRAVPLLPPPTIPHPPLPDCPPHHVKENRGGSWASSRRSGVGGASLRHEAEERVTAHTIHLAWVLIHHPEAFPWESVQPTWKTSDKEPAPHIFQPASHRSQN